MAILFDNTPYLEYIKISRIDQNGNDNTISLQSLTQITLPFTDGTSTTYLIDNITRYNTYFLFGIKRTGDNAPLSADSSSLNYSFTGSIDGGEIDMRAVGGIAAPFPTINGTGSSVSFLYNSSANKIELGTYPEIPIHVKATGFYVTSSAEVFVDLYKADSFYTPSSIVKLTTSTAIQGGALKGPFTREVSISGSAHAGDTLFLGASANSFPVAGGPFVRVEGGVGKDAIAAIFITSSTELVGPTISSVLEPYLTSQFEGTDCDVLLNNESLYRENPFLQDIDYSGNPFIPVNFNQLISGSAAKGTVPESYYTSLAQTNIRYNGSKAQSSAVNIFDPNAGNSDFGEPINIGNYGQTPSVTALDNVIAEFEWVGGASPEIPGGSTFSLKNRLFEVSSKELVKILTPDENVVEFGVKNTIKTGSDSDNYSFIRTISQSRGDYYQVLNNTFGPGKQLIPFDYGNAGINPQREIPAFATVVDNTQWVPGVSSFAGTSSHTIASSSLGYGVWFNDFDSIILQAKVSQVEGTITQFGSSYTDQTVIEVGTSEWVEEINYSLLTGNRWFITLLRNFEFPVGGIDASNRFTDIQNGSELNKLGVFEILGLQQPGLAGGGAVDINIDVTNKTGNSIFIGTNQNFTNLANLGFLIWKSQSNYSGQFLTVDKTARGIGNGAFYSRFATDIVREEFENITREYGGNTSD